MLLEWHFTVKAASVPVEAPGCEEDSDNDIMAWNDQNDGEQPIISERLAETQRRELQQLLQGFAGVLKGEPGRTSLTEHQSSSMESDPLDNYFTGCPMHIMS